MREKTNQTPIIEGLDEVIAERRERIKSLDQDIDAKKLSLQKVQAQIELEAELFRQREREGVIPAGHAFDEYITALMRDSLARAELFVNAHSTVVKDMRHTRVALEIETKKIEQFSLETHRLILGMESVVAAAQVLTKFLGAIEMLNGEGTLDKLEHIANALKTTP